jgi:hypothetical protein
MIVNVRGMEVPMEVVGIMRAAIWRPRRTEDDGAAGEVGANLRTGPGRD